MILQLPPIELERAKQRGWWLLLTFGFLFIPSFSILSGSAFRYILYTLPVISITYWMLNSGRGRLLTDLRYVVGLALYSVIPFISANMQIQEIDQATWVNALRPVFYIAAFIPLMVFTNKSVKVLILIFALTTIALWFAGVGTTRGEFSFGESKGLLETGLAFPLGGILIYCILRKERFWGFITFLLFFIALKRIAIGAVIAVLLIILFNRLIRKFLPNVREYSLALGMTFLVTGLAILVNLFYYEFFLFFTDLIGSNKTVSDITMGRLAEFDILARQYDSQTIGTLLFGNGPGDATRKLVEITIEYPLQVHNSFLLYFYDFGVLGFMMLLTAFLIIFSRNSFGLYLFIYNIIIMVTDNTFIHHYHQITYFILIAAMFHERQQDRLLRQKERERQLS